VDETDQFVDNEQSIKVNTVLLSQSLPPRLRRVFWAGVSADFFVGGPTLARTSSRGRPGQPGPSGGSGMSRRNSFSNLSAAAAASGGAGPSLGAPSPAPSPLQANASASDVAALLLSGHADSSAPS